MHVQHCSAAVTDSALFIITTEQFNIVPFTKVCFTQSCHTSSFLCYSVVHAFYETEPSGTHSTTMIAALVPADNRHNPLAADLKLWGLQVVNAVCPPRCHNFPAVDHLWLVVMLAHICRRCHYCHPVMLWLHSSAERSSASQVFGGGTPQRGSSQYAT